MRPELQYPRYSDASYVPFYGLILARAQLQAALSQLGPKLLCVGYQN
jgi:hypothetical protein